MRIKILENNSSPRLKVICRECEDGDTVYVKELRCFFTREEGGVIRAAGNRGKEDYIFCRSCEAEYDYKSYRKFLLEYYKESE